MQIKNNQQVFLDVERTYKKMKYYTGEKDEYKEMEIAYILVSPKDKTKVYAFISNKDSTDVFFYNPYKDREVKFAMGFNFEEYLFDYLNQYEIVKMPKDTHICVWQSIVEAFESDGFLHKNLPKYLEYCNRNGISAERLFEKNEAKNYDVMEIFKKSNKIKSKETEPER